MDDGLVAQGRTIGSAMIEVRNVNMRNMTDSGPRQQPVEVGSIPVQPVTEDSDAAGIEAIPAERPAVQRNLTDSGPPQRSYRVSRGSFRVDPGDLATAASTNLPLVQPSDETAARRWISSPAALAMVVGTACLVLLFAAAQAASFAASLAALPPALSTPLVAVAGILLAATLLAGWRLGTTWLRLRKNDQLYVTEFNSRRRLRQRTEKGGIRCDRNDARQALEAYVRSYPASPADRPAQPPQPENVPTTRLARLLTRDGLRRLTILRARLTDPSRTDGDAHWLELFEADFLGEIDRAANKCVDTAAKHLAWKAALSPNPLLDSLITLGWSFHMLRDLCLLYNLRVGSFGAMRLLSHVLLNAYFATRVDTWEEPMQDIVEEAIGESVVGKVAGWVTAKGASATANYWLLQRLGRHAIGMLRPIAT